MIGIFLASFLFGIKRETSAYRSVCLILFCCFPVTIVVIAAVAASVAVAAIALAVS